MFSKMIQHWTAIILILELGEKVKDDPNIVIAKIDVTANHPPRHFSYEGFPTIFWAGMSNKVCRSNSAPPLLYILV